MHWTQITYAALLVLAIWHGRPDWRIAAICVCNFTGTMALAVSQTWVAILDLATICALIVIMTPKALALAAIFAAIIPVYMVGTTQNWPVALTYGIVDVFGLAILGVLSSGTGGRGIRSWSLGRLRNSGGSGAVPAGGGAQVSRPHHRQDIAS